VAEACEISARDRRALMNIEGLRVGTVYLAPGAYYGRLFPEVMEVLERNQAKTHALGQVVWLR
jgi:hypothetical protein